MHDMPRPKLPNLHRQRTRHGAVTWYVRKGHGPRIRIRAEYGTPDFVEAYHAAMAGERSERKSPAVASDTVRWLTERYRETSAWSRLSPATRKQRDNIFRPILEQIGDKPIAVITKASIQASMERRAKTPFQAKNFLDAMRGMVRWAQAAQIIDADPTVGIKAVKPKTDGFAVWSEDQIASFEAYWPVGTRERLAFDLLLYTGLRRGDIAMLGRQHVKDGVITMRTAKTGQVVTLPILPQLAASIAASPTGDLAFVAGVNGRPMVKEAFGNWFREICNKAGVPGSAHGLRKAAATRLATNGATVAQLNAVFGWSGAEMASLYTRAADRQRLAHDVMSKLSIRNPIPPPVQKVGE